MLVMKPYSEDLRRKIVAAVEGGMPKTQAARLFGLSLSFCQALLQARGLRGAARSPQGRRETPKG